MEQTKTKPLEELIAEAIGVGRSIAASARALNLGGTAQAAGLASRALAPFARGEGFEERDDAAVDLLLDLLKKDIERETTGREIRLVAPETSGDEDCIAWREVPVLTARGQDLHALHDRFRHYVILRDIVRDKLLAEAYLLRRLRS